MDRDALPVRDESRWWPLLRRADQATIAVLITALFLLIVLRWCYLATFREGLIEVDRAPQRTPDFSLRINHADWPELTLLPGIGPTLAERIVVSRRDHGPFQSAEELERIKGIGPKTVRRIAPYLRFD
jgi:competence protein ComEA